MMPPASTNGIFGSPGIRQSVSAAKPAIRSGIRLFGDLADDVRAHVVVARGPGDDQAGGDREQQRRDLGDEAVADREQAVRRDRVAERHPHLADADGEAADQVDQRDDDRRDRVALDELRGTVHRAVEVGLGVHLGAALAGLVLVDEPGVQVGVDGHLLAGHRVEGEPGADLGHAAGTVGDDDELDDQEDREHDQADDERAADHEVAERVDHLAGVPVEQHEAGGADVQRQPEERHHQDHGGEGREVEGAGHEHRDHQHQQRAGDVQGDQQVEDDRGQRHHEHHDDEHDADGDTQLRQLLHRCILRGRWIGRRPWHRLDSVLASGSLSAGFDGS